MLVEGQIYWCPVCGAEIKVLKGADEVMPLMCCGVEMELVKTVKVERR